MTEMTYDPDEHVADPITWPPHIMAALADMRRRAAALTDVEISDLAWHQRQQPHVRREDWGYGVVEPGSPIAAECRAVATAVRSGRPDVWRDTPRMLPGGRWPLTDTDVHVAAMAAGRAALLLLLNPSEITAALVGLADPWRAVIGPVTDR